MIELLLQKSVQAGEMSALFKWVWIGKRRDPTDEHAAQASVHKVFWRATIHPDCAQLTATRG